jgi:MFS family permease
MNKNLLKLLFICFLDMLCYAIFSPVAAFLFLDGDYSLLPKNSENRYLFFGFFLSTYSFVQIFSSPLLGRLALKKSKKFILMCSFFGNVCGYLFCLYAIMTQNIVFLFLGSATAGLTGANMSMVNAFISSETSSHRWSRNYSLFGAVIGTAFIIGPQISSLFFSHYSGFKVFYLILLLCSVISVCNCFLVHFLLQERMDASEDSFRKIEATSSVFSFSNLNFLSLSKSTYQIFIFLFLIYFSWLSFIKFFQVYLVEVFSLNESDCCQMTSFLGFCCCFWQLLRYSFKFKFLDSYKWFVGCCLFMGINFFIYSFVESVSFLLFLTLFITFSYSVLAPSVLSLLFRNDDARLSKTYKSSINQSLKALAQIAAPLFSGYLLSKSSISPNAVAVVAVFAAFFLILLNPNSFTSHSEEKTI